MIFSCKTLTDKWGKQGEKIVYIGRKDESSCRKVENAAGALWGDLVILISNIGWENEWRKAVSWGRRVKRQTLFQGQRTNDGGEAFWASLCLPLTFPFFFPTLGSYLNFKVRRFKKKRKRLNKLSSVSPVRHWEMLAMLTPVALTAHKNELSMQGWCLLQQWP